MSKDYYFGLLVQWFGSKLHIDFAAMSEVICEELSSRAPPAMHLEICYGMNSLCFEV